ncbi:hypothetical protein SMITH_220 [Smithella sp. ME-1]|uniref:HTH cro/C1-type domain-containing protein n=1 Tax=hydrocarbon metagenome TaxID=938273 RepID=A0A0W8FNU3_9ZZZZ|nr:hypothetical protein SMITH_220 [Smithella sp. ME-1]
MKANHLTTNDKKRGRYIKSLLILRGIEQQKIAEEVKASEALVSQVIRGHRKGVARNGKKITEIKQLLADKLGRQVEDLWPRRAA